MRAREILEAPIDQFQLIGDFDQPGSLDTTKGDVSRTMVQQPKYQAKVRRLWEKTPFTFNFYIINHKQGYFNPANWSVSSPEQAFRIAPGIKPTFKHDPNAISIVYTTNETGYLVPMTAWILAHRFSHAFHLNGGKVPEFHQLEVDLFNFIQAIANDVYGSTSQQKATGAFRSEVDGETKTHAVFLNDPALFWEIVHAILTMRSARIKKIGSGLDLGPELMAQYLMMGKVTFNPLPAVIENTYNAKYNHNAKPEQLARYNAMLPEWIKKIEAALQQTLERLKGKVVTF